MRYLVLGMFAAAVAGCSAPSGPLSTPQVSVTATASNFVHLEAGGLAIPGAGDTAVNFDLVPTVSIKNDSSSTIHLLAIWELWSKGGSAQVPINVIKPNETPSITSTDIFRDTLDLGSVAAGASVSIDSIPIVTFSDSDLKGGKLEYSLSIELPDGRLMAWEADNIPPFEDPLGGSFDSVPFASRWRGIIYTTETSPNYIAVFDGPEDGDWQGDSLFSVSPAFPNPATGATTLKFSTTQGFDSVRADLFITPHHILRSISLSAHNPGTYEAMFNLSGIAPGLYRMQLTAFKNGVAASSRGDIMVPLP